MEYERDDDDDAFDENGVLKDGRLYRVPMRMMDSLQRAIHEHAQRVKVRILDAPLHQPGFVRTARPVAERRAIYDAYDAEIEQKFRNMPNVSNDQVIQQLPRPKKAADDRLAAYQEYDAAIQVAHRRVIP